MGASENTAAFIPRLVVPGVACLVGLVLVGLALPRVAAYAHAISWRSLSLAEPSGRDTHADVDAMLDDYRKATAWQPGDAALQEIRGRLALLALRPDRPDNAALKSEATTSLSRAIAAAPDNACAWAMYAYGGSRYALPGVTVAPAIRLAYILSPPPPPCTGLRLSVLLARPEAIPADLMPYVQGDMKGLWFNMRFRRSTDFIYVYRAAPPEGRTLFRATVVQTPRDQRDFDAVTRDVPRAAPR